MVTERLQRDNGLTGRIGYIDALRGLTMFMVVFNHVALFYLHVPEDSPSLHRYLLQVQMPLFFFISGFVFFKAEAVWNGGYLARLFKKKTVRLLIVPFLFFIVNLLIKGGSLGDAIMNPWKMGYWFTLVLFEYMAFYVIIRLCLPRRWVGVALVVLGLILFPCSWIEHYRRIPVPEDIMCVLSTFHWGYFIYFVFGILARKHFACVERWLDRRWLVPLCLVVYIAGNVLYDRIPVEPMYKEFPLAVSGLVILFALFRAKGSSWFSRENAAGRVLQFMGRRTLDIYLINYWLIPTDFNGITVFAEHPMPLVEACVSAVMAAVIVAASLLIGAILRRSPLLARFLFGEKVPSKE